MRAIGIDLGTTNSAAAAAGKNVRVLPTRAGEMLTPSVVSFVKKRRSKEGEIVVGRAAANNAARDPQNAIFSIKRLMGRVYGEDKVDEVRRRATFIIADPPPEDEADQSLRVQLGSELYTPVEISARILKQVKEDAEQALGQPVTHAVITVPAYFEERQRSATEEAGRLAGLNVLKTIDEPTAAAIAYGAGKEEEKHRILVYDLGGGTFDISIIQMVGGQYQILEIQGDTWLGGDDFDRTIVQRTIDWVKEELDVDPSEDKSFLARAREEAEKIKIALSTQESADLFAPLLRLPGEGVVDVDMTFTREEFEEDIDPFVVKTIDLVERALQSQHLRPEDITEVLLVGGSTAVPKVQDAVAEVFGRDKVRRNVNPMQCVALGAAILADRFELKADGAADDQSVRRDFVEVTALHLGIAAVKGSSVDAFVPIIPKGTPYPLSEPKKQIFHPTEEGQRLIKVPVYEGLNELASLNEQQGTIEFPLPQGIDSNTPVEVSFNYDSNRVLTVGIRVVGTDLAIEETLRRDRGRAARERREAESLMDDWREDLQPTLRAASHFLNSYGPYMSAEDREELQVATQDGNRALEKQNEIDGKRATATLQHKMMGSGVASLLFMAERVMQGAPDQVVRKLAMAVAQLREAHETGNEPKVHELGGHLRVMVAGVMAERGRIEGVEDRKNLEHLLRVRE